MLKRKMSLVIMALLFFLTFNVLASRRSESQPPSEAVLYLSPSLIADPTITPPAIVAVNVSIFNVTNMAYCEFNLSYTPGIFYVVELAKQSVQGQIPSMYYEIEDYLGYVFVKLSYGTPITVSENATLLILNFAVIDYGITPLSFHDGIMKDGDSNNIPFTTEDGLLAIIKHDIAVTNVVSLPSETYVGRIVQVTVTLDNFGNVPENFATTIYADGNNITTLDILNLQPAETRIIAYDWNTTSLAASNTPYAIKAEAEIMPYETNTTNNVYADGNVKLKLVGDVNGDGTVNIDDLIAWDAAYGSIQGDPNWNAQADINGDAVVDNLDGYLILQNYHSTL